MSSIDITGGTTTDGGQGINTSENFTLGVWDIVAIVAYFTTILTVGCIVRYSSTLHIIECMC